MSTGTPSSTVSEPAECVAVEGQPPRLHPLHLGHDGAAEGCPARHRRSSRGTRLDDVGDLRRRPPATCSGPPPTSAGSSVTATSAMRRSSTAAPRSSTRASPSHPRRRRLLARHRRAQGEGPSSPRPPPSGRSSATIRTGARLADYDLSSLEAALSRRRAGRPRHDPLGAGEARGAGDRPLVADRDRLRDRREPHGGSNPCPSRSARHRSRCRATTCAFLDEGGHPVPPGTLGAHRRETAPAPRARCRPSWNADDRFRKELS